MSRRILVVACVVALAPIAKAQQQSIPRYTQMVLGLSHTFKARAYNLGFEHKPADSPIAWRVMLERWSRQTHTDDFFLTSQELFGAQFVGLRLFRQRHALQPYILGGLGLYHEKSWSATRVIDPMDGATWLHGRSERLVPTIVWGSGLSLRVRAVTFFGEFKLPVPSQGYGFAGPAAPLTFGIRF